MKIVKIVIKKNRIWGIYPISRQTQLDEGEWKQMNMDEIIDENMSACKWISWSSLFEE